MKFMVLEEKIIHQKNQGIIPEEALSAESRREIKPYTREELVSLSRFLKYEWEGGVPQDTKHSTDLTPRWKVRNGWFALIVGLIEQVELAQAEGLIDNFDAATQMTMKQFKNQVCNPEFIGRLKTEEDIKAGDEMLDIILQKIAD